MEKHKFTKGEWKITKPTGAFIVCNEHPICAISLSTQENLANAKLIAAAPNMLEALENLENDNGQIPDHAWKMVQGAIKKAIG